MNIAAAHTYTDSEDSFDFDFLEDYTEFARVEELGGEMDPPMLITSLLIRMNPQLNRGRDSFGGEGGISRGVQLYLIMVYSWVYCIHDLAILEMNRGVKTSFGLTG